ncbi:MAG TPA: TIGR03943 family protein [Gaiellaceae bacterium]|nr:TIGR03943 family protein [Gaiellaceae bacterium]
MAAVTAAGGTISLLVGAVLLRLTVTDTYRRYVRPEMGLWLAIAGIAVIALGLVTLIWSLRASEDHDGHEHEDDEHGVGVGWLLLAPIAALLLVAPPTLGSYGVGRAATVKIRSGKGAFRPLPKASAPRQMTLVEFSQRAYERNGASFNGQPVELTGFVAEPQAGGFELARYQISCCAADAAPVVVRVVGTSGDPPPRDQWVTVTGTFEAEGGDVPKLAATSLAEIPAPNDPYE